MRQRRGAVADRHLTDGPGKLCKALAIDRTLYGADLTTGAELFIEEGSEVPGGGGLSDTTRRRGWGRAGPDAALALHLATHSLEPNPVPTPPGHRLAIRLTIPSSGMRRMAAPNR